MSVDLQLTDNSLSLEQWQELCEAWSRQQEIQLFGEAQFQEGEKPRLYVSGPGSIRGFYVELNGGDVEIHIPAMASTHDWRRCYSLLQQAVREGGGSVRLEEGQLYGAEDLSPENADSDAEVNLMLPLNMMKSRATSGESEFDFPTPHFNLKVTAADLELDRDELLEALAGQFERYASAFRPSMKFNGERGEGAAWALIPSIFPKLDWLLISGDDPDELLELPWSELERVIGHQMESVGSDRYFLPGQEDLGAELIADLRRASTLRKKTRDERPEEERMLHSVLVSAPVAAVLAIAGADGKVDEKEFGAAVEFMTELVQKNGSVAVRQIYAESVSQLKPILDMLTGDALPKVLASVPQAMDRLLDSKDKALFVDSLVRLMQATAAASGGLLSFGENISRKERKRIAAIEAMLLGIDGAN